MDRIQFRRDIAENWQTHNPVLMEGEIGLVTDNPNQYKMGDGINNWNDLPLRGYTGTISQELGDDENAVMSQKTMTDELKKINSNTGIDEYPAFSDQTDYKVGDVVNYQGKLYQFTSEHTTGEWTGTDIKKYSLKDREDYLELNINSQNLYPKLRLNRGYYINTDNYKISDRETSTNFAFKVISGETIIYTGNYGGSCPAVIFYKNGEILSSITKTDLELNTTIEIVVTEGADSAVAN